MVQTLIVVALLTAPAAALTPPTSARARPRRTALKSIKVTYLEPDAAAEMGVRLCGNQPVCRVRVDGVEVDATIQHERAVNLISTQACANGPSRIGRMAPRRRCRPARSATF